MAGGVIEASHFSFETFKDFSKNVFLPISTQKFPKIPKIILRNPCDEPKHTKPPRERKELILLRPGHDNDISCQSNGNFSLELQFILDKTTVYFDRKRGHTVIAHLGGPVHLSELLSEFSFWST